jgi:O-antigen biosynthesis protein
LCRQGIDKTFETNGMTAKNSVKVEKFIAMNICLVTTEILGAHRNGGIGTATSHLAVMLADAGNNVTLLYGGDDPVEFGSLWHGVYHRFNISVRHLRPQECGGVEPWILRYSVAIFEYLRGASFDAVFFQDWLGAAQASVLAKRAGIAFAECHLSVIAHGNGEWVLDATGKLPETRDQLLQIEVERQAVEFADSLISPSAYLVEWMREHGWLLPVQTRVIPHFLHGLRIAGVERAFARGARRSTRHLVFFGRLEARKGIYLFLETLREPALRGEQFELSFLGKESDINQDQLTTWLGENRPDLQPLARFHKNKNVEGALDYLKACGGIAVIPSLTENSPCVVWECIEHGIPFISTHVGGIPEMVADDVRDEVLVLPESAALAGRLRAMLDLATCPEVKHRHSQAEARHAWLDFLEYTSVVSTAPSASGVATGRQAERVSVLLLDLADEDALRARLEELYLQTSNEFDTIIVSARSPAQFAGCLVNELASTWVNRESGSLSARILAGAEATDAGVLVVADTRSAMSSDSVEVLHLSMTAFPDTIVTGQFIRVPPQETKGARAFLRRGLPRQGYLGGPLCLGALENCFGGFPIGIRRDTLFATLSPDNAAADVWPLLTSCALAGRRILSLPIVLATEPQVQSTPISSSERENHRDAVRRLYQSRLPASVQSFVHIGRW